MTGSFGASIARGLLVGIAVAFGVAMPQSAGAATKVLHAFCAEADCADGGTPQFPPIADSDGVLYGTAEASANNAGLVYALTPNGTGGYTYGVLYRFCSVAGCTDGTSPSSPLIIDTQGNLYGTTLLGGAHNSGTLFELEPNARRTTWKEVVRHSFCPSGAPCAGGEWPTGQLTYPGATSGALYDGVSPIYGTTRAGGTGDGGNGVGTAFQITPVTGQTKWPQNVVYNFCAEANCTDGATPETGLIIGAHGALFGTTFSGGNGGVNGWGTVFRIDPKQQTEAVIYAFCQQIDCLDGRYPVGPLALGAKGLLYGTTQYGGAADKGTIFRIDPSIPLADPVLYNFCDPATCTDGAYPNAGVAIDPNDNLFGVTQYGGANYSTNCDNTGFGCGILYRFSPKKSKLTVSAQFLRGRPSRLCRWCGAAVRRASPRHLRQCVRRGEQRRQAWRWHGIRADAIILWSAPVEALPAASAIGSTSRTGL